MTNCEVFPYSLNAAKAISNDTNTKSIMILQIFYLRRQIKSHSENFGFMPKGTDSALLMQLQSSRVVFVSLAYLQIFFV